MRDKTRFFNLLVVYLTVLIVQCGEDSSQQNTEATGESVPTYGASPYTNNSQDFKETEPFDKNKGLPAKQIDKHLSFYLDQFIDKCNEHNIEIPQLIVDRLVKLTFVDQSEMKEVAQASADLKVVLGNCRIAKFINAVNVTDHYLEVRIAKSWQDWLDGGDIRLKQLVFHELYHCLLGKKHAPCEVGGLMAPVVFQQDSRVTEEGFDDFVDQAFEEDYMNKLRDLKGVYFINMNATTSADDIDLTEKVFWPNRQQEG